MSHRLSFLSNNKQTRDIYAQLQAPGQAKAVRDSFASDIGKGTVAYETALRNANVAGYGQTIDPRQLVSYWSSPTPRNIDAPASRSPVQFTPSAQSFDLFGRPVNLNSVQQAYQTPASYSAAVSGVKSQQAQQAQQAQEAQAETQRQYVPLRASGQDYDRNHSDPDYYYNLQRSSRVDLPDYNRLFFMQQAAAREQAAINRYQASQSTLSSSFYSGGGHDSPSSFPRGF